MNEQYVTASIHVCISQGTQCHKQINRMKCTSNNINNIIVYDTVKIQYIASI